MHAGAKLRKEPEASPNTALNIYRPGSVSPNGNQITKIARAPSAIRIACVLMRPYLSAMPPAISRPTVENLAIECVSSKTHHGEAMDDCSYTLSTARRITLVEVLKPCITTYVGYRPIPAKTSNSKPVYLSVTYRSRLIMDHVICTY